jgi:hypothetical protein
VNTSEPTVLDFVSALRDGETVDLEPLKLRHLATMTRIDWGQKTYFGAVPYLRAMSTLEDVTSRYGADEGDMIVAYFLTNAGTWRGPVARAVKNELKRRIGR